MTVLAGIWWEPAYRGGRMEQLEPVECRRLLVSGSFGRLGYRTNDEQRLVPMDYVVIDDYLVFRTSSDHDIAQSVPWQSVAFEVDDVDAFLQAGWSVLVNGIAEELPRDSLRAVGADAAPEPAAEGVRSLYIRIPLTRITGLRVHAV